MKPRKEFSGLPFFLKCMYLRRDHAFSSPHEQSASAVKLAQIGSLNLCEYKLTAVTSNLIERNYRYGQFRHIAKWFWLRERLISILGCWYKLSDLLLKRGGGGYAMSNDQSLVSISAWDIPARLSIVQNSKFLQSLCSKRLWCCSKFDFSKSA